MLRHSFASTRVTRGKYRSLQSALSRKKILVQGSEALMFPALVRDRRSHARVVAGRDSRLSCTPATARSMRSLLATATEVAGDEAWPSDIGGGQSKFRTRTSREQWS